MARGGKRQGAGRKTGSTNRFSKELLLAAKESGILPVEFLLEVMRDPSLPLARSHRRGKISCSLPTPPPGIHVGIDSS